MVEALRRGLDTGQVMEDEIARRRESIPPPSVSRVMQRMGMTTPADTPREHMPQRELPPLPPAPRPPAPTVTGYGSQAPLESPPVAPPPVAPPPVAPPPAAPPPVAPPAPTSSPTITGMPPAPEPRRRTGTPEMGVPAVAVQPPVTGQIEQPAGRARTPTRDPIGISQVWYEDGDRASEEADGVRARKTISPSTTDMSLYDEATMPRRRWPLLFGAAAVVLVVGGTIVFALTRGGDSKTTTTPPPVASNAPANTATVDAAPSQVIGETGSGSGSGEVVADQDPKGTVKPGKTTPVVREAHSGRERPRVTDPGDDEPAPKHRPTVDVRPEPPPKTTVVVKTGTGSGSGKTGVSGADGPQDPYASGDTTDPGDGAPPEKKAEFYANLGAQQLGSGDNAGAASSFKKAIELDPKNVNAVTGMGEIALRQGLFGDAIAHLKKAARMAPKSSRVFTLLGEAYLNSGQNAVAADNFKKALQLDPENARAREGYNEASSRVPPPSDDN